MKLMKLLLLSIICILFISCSKKEGCIDDSGCNFESSAEIDDGSCTYAEEYYDCDGVCLSDTDSDGICNELEVLGCTDNTACNYDDSATDSDGSCTYAEEYYDCDGVCLSDTDSDGVCDELDTCPNDADNDIDGDGVCGDAEILGCTDTTACNYDDSATDSDGSCIYTDGICETCSGETDGSGTIVDNDMDDDGVCDELPDIDGNLYETVVIGTQLWMAENLKTTHYQNGDAITHITNNSDWGSYDEGQYGVYDNDPTNADIYGNLYNWATVDDRRKVCPEGWHVPSDEEYTELTDFLGGTSVEGGKMKEEGLAHWNSPNTGATNESGFTAFPGGYRYYNNGYYDNMGNNSYFWSSSEYNSYAAWSRKLYYNNSNVNRSYYNKEFGFSVRCVGD